MKYCKLMELCTDIVDCPHSTPCWQSSGIRVVRNFNLKNGNLDFSDDYYVNEETYRERTRRAIPEEGDIIISREAPVGVVGIIPPGLKCCLGQRLVLLKVNKTIVNPYYLLFALMSDFVQTQFNRADRTGSIVSNLCIPDLQNIVIPVIEEDQESIAKFLENINNKLIVNNKINDNLQAQVKTIYDYWFTQFDFPDENGNPYKSSGGAMVWNEIVKKNIPDSWTIANIIKNPYVKVIKPGVELFSTKEYLATAEVNGTDISTGSIIDYETRENRANMQPMINSVWFAKMKNSIKHLFLNEAMKPIIDNVILSTGFCGLQCTESSFEYIVSFISSDYFETIKDTLAHGATQEAVNNDDMEEIKILVPSSDVIQTFHETTKGIFTQISKNICENRELTKLRDWLLPMLMNGQATISD